MLRTLLFTTLLLSAAAQAREWTVDPAGSTLGFKGTYQGDGFAGTFRRFEAKIRYDEADLGASRFEVDVDTGSADTGSAERDESLQGGDFFAVAKFPKAHFVTKSFAKGADGRVTAQGTLTIRDRTRPVTLQVRFVADGDRATLDVDTVLQRADFGLGDGSDWAEIGAEVPVHGHLVLTAK